MDSFIVRFYRRTQEVVGTVERVGSDERAGFVGRDELLERLLAPRGPAEAAEAERADPREQA